MRSDNEQHRRFLARSIQHNGLLDCYFETHSYRGSTRFSIFIRSSFIAFILHSMILREERKSKQNVLLGMLTRCVGMLARWKMLGTWTRYIHASDIEAHWEKRRGPGYRFDKCSNAETRTISYDGSHDVTWVHPSPFLTFSEFRSW